MHFRVVLPLWYLDFQIPPLSVRYRKWSNLKNPLKNTNNLSRSTSWTNMIINMWINVLSHWKLPRSQHNELQYHHTAHQQFKTCYCLLSECIDWWRDIIMEEHLTTLWVKCPLFSADCLISAKWFGTPYSLLEQFFWHTEEFRWFLTYVYLFTLTIQTLLYHWLLILTATYYWFSLLFRVFLLVKT